MARLPSSRSSTTKAFTAANSKKEQLFYDSELTFRVRTKVGSTEKIETLAVGPKDDVAAKFKALFAAKPKPEIVSVEWTHRDYARADEYVQQGDDIDAFLAREIAESTIRWEDSPQLGYEILANKYFYRYQPPTPANELLSQFWKLEKDTEKMLAGLER